MAAEIGDGRPLAGLRLHKSRTRFGQRYRSPTRAAATQSDSTPDGSSNPTADERGKTRRIQQSNGHQNEFNGSAGGRSMRRRRRRRRRGSIQRKGRDRGTRSWKSRCEVELHRFLRNERPWEGVAAWFRARNWLCCWIRCRYAEECKSEFG